MRPDWFERGTNASIARGARDAQYKASLFSTTPEDQSEILFSVDY
ncbi:MAG TPA: hypothetical protein VIH18_29695 [Candidatus Binatia bacterium]